MALARARALAEKEAAQKREDDMIQFEMIKAGDATHYPQRYDSCAIHYTARLEDGSMIDNSYKRGQPTYFVLGNGTVIKGFEKVLLAGHVSKGQVIRLTLPHQLAYGEKGYPPVIPPKATVIFELELISFSSEGHIERIPAAK
jgi:FKBP-type peptidyl-prolyl cis-trans isomerase